MASRMRWSGSFSRRWPSALTFRSGPSRPTRRGVPSRGVRPESADAGGRVRTRSGCPSDPAGAGHCLGAVRNRLLIHEQASTTRHISISCCQSRLLRRSVTLGVPLPLRLCQGRRRPPSVQAGPRHHSGRGAPKVLIDDLDFRPSQGAQLILHGILQRAALAIVDDLVR